MALSVCWRSAAGVGVPRLVLWSRRALHGAPVSRAPLAALCCSHTGAPSTTWSSLRPFSSAADPYDVSYGQLKRDLAGRTAVVIDVREPWELREYGTIPGSINVPLAQVDAALQLNPEDFKEKYGGDMPKTADRIVFSCLAGIRSKKALDTAALLGYKDVLHYAGGWQNWAENEQLKPHS